MDDLIVTVDEFTYQKSPASAEHGRTVDGEACEILKRKLSTLPPPPADQADADSPKSE